MSIEKIIERLKAVEGLNLTEEEIQLIQGNKTDIKADNSELIAEKAAKARILNEAKAAKSKTAELEAELEALRSKDLSDVEKTQKEVEKMQKAQQKVQEEYDNLQKAHAKTVKSYQLEKVSGTIKFMDTIPSDLKQMAIERVFGEIDFDNVDAVNSARDSFNDTYKSILASENTAKGSGSQNNGQDMKTGLKTPDKMSIDERAAYLMNKNK